MASTRVPADLHDRFRQVAESEYRTISQELRRLMERRVDEAELEQAA